MQKQNAGYFAPCLIKVEIKLCKKCELIKVICIKRTYVYIYYTDLHYLEIFNKIVDPRNLRLKSNMIKGISPMLKLIYYVPESHLELTKEAVFAAGAGGIGNYEHCAWQVLGTGQFKPVKGAKPFIGALDQLEQIPEWRVETIVAEDVVKAVAQALIKSHPYEEPAFEFIQIFEIDLN